MFDPVSPALFVSYLTAEAAKPQYSEHLRIEAATLVKLVAGHAEASQLLGEARRRQLGIAETIALFRSRTLERGPAKKRDGARWTGAMLPSTGG